MTYTHNLDSQIDQIKQSCYVLLDDMRYYAHIDESPFFQSGVQQIIKRIDGLRLLIFESNGENNFKDLEVVFEDIKEDLYVLKKRWKLACGSLYSKAPSKLEQAFSDPKSE